MKNALLWILIVIVLIFGGLAIKIVFFPVDTVSQSIEMAYEVTNETLTGKNAIENYEWFKEQEAYIRQCLKNEIIAQEEYDFYIATLPTDRTTWDRTDKQEESSLRNSKYALEKLTNKAMEDYNAKASMENRAIFKDNLPSNITRAFYAGMDLTH